MLQTKLMVLRKYDYNREEIYLEKIFEAINQEYPDLKDKADALHLKLQNILMEEREIKWLNICGMEKWIVAGRG